ncbi:winged helix-turn-helix transcriptional regulator [Streptomyces sp. BH-SS-21]|uniref:Winged helix-turn-helix transcriptional regulator n=1 Tax=Streptomyces liliiviolaceus TaxID=2823109 RepID=A0A940XZQ4_9ACTN|nr:helix-turn-helix domain-containing protein [Streptomyces liliiviolaceus]MBQ0853862.1 winged helix-turn-helix transcriptional regulator [Streptomyces liliiviolaceus]
MLRVHFTTEDVARVRVAAAADPLWEITNSFQILITQEAPLLFGSWRRSVRPRLPEASRLLAALLPPQGYSPDFLTPDLGGHYDLASAIDTVLSTPRTDLRRDMTRLAASRRRPVRRPAYTHAHGLAEGDTETLRQLGAALQAYHRLALAPYWPHIQAQVDADHVVRGRAVLEGGTDGLLAGFRPVLRWEPPVLEADYPVERELRLEGRGLLLQPSFFCHRRPVTLAAPDATPVVVYPIQHTLGRPAPKATGDRARSAELAALIGRTRAAILEDVVAGRTTGELADRFGISGAAASYHATVLRRAGLLLSVRRSTRVLHTISPAGLILLDSAPGASERRPPSV